MLDEVRAALRRGDHRGAADRFATARTRLARSTLGQERDALEIKIAVAAGERGNAASLARAFLDRYPESPLRAEIESLAREGR